MTWPAPEVFLDCVKHPLSDYQTGGQRYLALRNMLTSYNSPSPIVEAIPNGVKEERKQIETMTIGSTLIGFFIIAYFMIKKSKDVVVKEDDDGNKKT